VLPQSHEGTKTFLICPGGNKPQNKVIFFYYLPKMIKPVRCASPQLRTERVQSAGAQSRHALRVVPINVAFTTETRSVELMRRPEPAEGNSIENNIMGE